MVQVRDARGRYAKVNNVNGYTDKEKLYLIHNRISQMNQAIQNTETTRSNFIKRGGDPRRSINDEVGYPDEITLQNYQEMYDREGVAARVVEVLPKESWRTQPVVFETEDTSEETTFEKDWKKLAKSLRGGKSWYNGENGNPIWEHLLRVDVLSGIGTFGVLLIGLDDGADLSKPAVSKKGRKVTFLRSFSESQVAVESLENKLEDPRFGLPLMYEISFDVSEEDTSFLGVKKTTESTKVHWSRVLHVADNLGSSEIFGTPRQKPVYNRIYDLRKVYAGSGEMYWRGAFPGLSLETHPQLGGDVVLDTSSLKDAAEQYMNTLQRYIISTGINVKSLAPQVVDPTPQIEAYLNAIAIRLGIPMRVLMGSERGELASSQDNKTWNGRLKIRQNFHITDRMIVPLVDRFIMLGVLSEPKSGYTVVWPDLDTISEKERAGVAGQQAQALSTYVAGNVEAMLEPQDFFTKILGFGDEEAAGIIKRAKKAAPLPEEGSWMTIRAGDGLESTTEVETRVKGELGVKEKKAKAPLQSGQGGQVKKATQPGK